MHEMWQMEVLIAKFLKQLNTILMADCSLKLPNDSELWDLIGETLKHAKKVVSAFICGSGIRSYSGDIAAQRMQEAEVASKFLAHPIGAIREWAKLEKHSSEIYAAQWRQEDEERFI